MAVATESESDPDMEAFDDVVDVRRRRRPCCGCCVRFRFDEGNAVVLRLCSRADDGNAANDDDFFPDERSTDAADADADEGDTPSEPVLLLCSAAIFAAFARCSASAAASVLGGNDIDGITVNGMA